MKEVLPKYGIEFIEIPRNTIKDQVISASTVRSLMRVGRWDELRWYVPETTYQYLRKNFSNWKGGHHCKKNKWTPYVERFLNSMLNFIYAHRKLVLYGLGEDAAVLLSYVPEEQCGEMVYCDKRACESSMKYRGKEVIQPKQLQTEYQDYAILVTSSRYAYEIYREWSLVWEKDAREVMFNNYPIHIFG